MTFGRPARLGACIALCLWGAGCRHGAGAGLTSRDRALRQLESGHPDEAIPLLDEAFAKDPADLELARTRVEAYVKAHRAQELIAQLEHPPKSVPPAVQRYMLGLARFAGPAEADKAIADFQAACALSPNEPELQYRLGLALLESERYPEALPVLKKAAQLSPNQRSWQLPLAKALYRTGDGKGAVEVLGRFVRARPPPEEVEPARRLMDAISDPFANLPQQARPKLEQGMAWLHDADVPQQAIVAFEEILADYPDLGFVHSLLGLAFQRIDDAGRAVDEFKRAIELSPEDGRPRMYLGLLYLSRQRPDQARVLFEEAVAHHPLLDDAWRELGELALERHQIDRAREAFMVLTSLSPKDGKARSRYAVALQLGGDFAGAEHELHTLLDQEPENVEAMLHLGLLEVERVHHATSTEDRDRAHDEAKRWLGKVLDAQPENALASRALEQLR